MVLAVAAMAFLASCDVKSVVGVVGDGVEKTESRTVTEFTALDVSGAFTVEWSKGEPSISVTSDENLIPLIKTEVSGNKLRIYSEGSVTTQKTMKVMVASHTVNEVESTGANHFSAHGLNSDALTLTATGASSFDVAGSAGSLTVKLTGASSLKAQELAAKTADVSLEGACNADLAVSEKLKADVGGASSLHYSGNPTTENHTSGAGSIHQRK